MMELLIVRTGLTEWDQQRRLDSLSGMPLCAEGMEMIRRVGKELVPHEPTCIYSSGGEAEQETADLLQKEIGKKVRCDKRFAEMDFGLWQGLTSDEIKRRQPTLHKQWLESPASVRPPGGETLEEVQIRLLDGLGDLVKKEKKQNPVLVLRPMVMGLLRCYIEKLDMDDLWKQVDGEPAWLIARYDEQQEAWSVK